jgi:ATP-binding cassette subfamily B protein
MRLYDPTVGEILLNDVNIKSYQVDEYRKAIGVIFQDYKLFAATIKENVLMDIDMGTNDEVVLNTLNKSGFTDRLQTLSEGLDTHLTMEFMENGVNLSGGESQKVAIARMLYKDSSLTILDEPSSTLDPIAEFHFNNTVMDTASDKTMIFISHRLSTTRISDIIYVLEQGKLVESGTHTDLVNNEGQYSTMWRAQTDRYISKVHA